MKYPDTLLHIAGSWRSGGDGRTLKVVNPASGAEIGSVAHAEQADLDDALTAAGAAFPGWRSTPGIERARLLRKAADLVRERAERIATLMTIEQGKPLWDSRGEVLGAADIIDWMAEEAKRTYGRVIPARGPSTYQLVLREPVGPVAAFTPWNFPVSQVARKMSTALAAGCTIVIKAAEETPASPAAMIQAFVDAGLPDGVVNLVYGDPAAISEHMIASPVIRKISFTGSTSVGKHLAALAGQHMKRATMELGGHAPAIVFDDADIDASAQILVALKYRNAGQICVSPTRFLVQDGVYDRFVDAFVAGAKALTVGDGLDETVRMGPLANARRLGAIEELIRDAVDSGGRIATGGRRIRNEGYYFEPTVITDTPVTARAMNEEPFGPIALISRFASFDDAVAEANRLRYGLASFAYTRSARRATDIAAAVEAGMMAINGFGIGLPEVPFGGVKDSGYGSEGGIEAMDAYQVVKMVSQTGV